MFGRRRPETTPTLDRPRRNIRSGKSVLLVGLAASAGLLATACAATGAYARADYAVAIAPLSLSLAAPTATPTPVPTLAPTPSPSPSPSPSPVPTDSPTPVPTPVPATPAPPVVRRNYLSIPALRINGSIGTTTCGGLIPNGIWRWPCAGANNLYLLGHASGSFAPIHNGYHAGSLTPGLAARYTDGAAVAHEYVLQWVQDLPLATWGKGATWAATPGPVITLVTCDGEGDSYRIVVRFIPA